MDYPSPNDLYLGFSRTLYSSDFSSLDLGRVDMNGVSEDLPSIQPTLKSLYMMS